MTLLAIILLGFQQQALTDAQCIACHEDQALEVKDTMHERAAVGCVSCHGTDEIVNEKHKRTIAFRSGRLPQIAGLCGACHKSAFDAFKDSEHFEAAKHDDGEKKHRSSCSACHDYHTTSGAVGSTILERCLECHEKDSYEFKEGASTFEDWDRHQEALKRLDDRLVALIGAPGIRTFDVEGEVEDADKVSRRMRSFQHSLEWKRMKADLGASAEKTKAAYNLLAAREESFARRFLGLGVFLVLLALSAILIVRRARSLQGDPRA
jgi:hypothetical protein